MKRKKGRITVSVLSDTTARFFEEGKRSRRFNPIAHLPLGYGIEGCSDTEAECYKTIAFFIEAAKQEKSTVFVLGFAPKVVPSLWIKTAELIIQGSDVRTVLIPIANKIDGWNNTVRGGILYVMKGGIHQVKSIGEVTAGDFWAQVVEEALNQS